MGYGGFAQVAISSRCCWFVFVVWVSSGDLFVGLFRCGSSDVVLDGVCCKYCVVVVDSIIFKVGLACFECWVNLKCFGRVRGTCLRVFLVSLRFPVFFGFDCCGFACLRAFRFISCLGFSVGPVWWAVGLCVCFFVSFFCFLVVSWVTVFVFFFCSGVCLFSLLVSFWVAFFVSRVFLV